ncbi:hypothetical protein N7G274_002222 [Stereocaulon virgatum]|uniref:rRNA methyltransferase 1, mitochondrial n=1 Tax=Stereocaulon virgatum TaxID=373712 RepID=A0ABR4AJV5_9LECA
MPNLHLVKSSRPFLVLCTHQLGAADVMLSAPWYLSNGTLYKQSLVRIQTLKLQTFQAFISTNTAINNSLRRSHYEGARSGRDGRSSSGRTGNISPRERMRRPNFGQGQGMEGIEGFIGVNESQPTLRHGRSTRGRATTNRRETAFDRPSRDTQRAYAPHPDGNRVLRRAVRFGHTIEEPSKEASNAASRQAIHLNDSSQADFHSAEPGRTTHASRRVLRWKQGGEDYEKFSVPENLRKDSENDIEVPRRSFTMGRRENLSYRAMYANGSRDIDQGSSRSRPSGESGKNRPRYDNQSPEDRESDVPLSIPYTTPASEFLYGTSVVVAALLSSRRKLYKLYIYEGDNREVRNQDMNIRRLARDRNVVVERVKGGWLLLMDKMSLGRPHNGYILEASPLPKLPVTGFRSVGTQRKSFDVILDYQSREDEAVNGTETEIKYDAGFPRYPLVLFLDGILDPGNLGAILRTAFFLGVDAVAISNRRSAPLSPVALKASAGASESLPLLMVNQPGQFLDKCQNNDWKIYAAVTPSPGNSSRTGHYFTTSTLGCPVQKHPCIVVLGGEGEGLRWNIQSKANFNVGIEGRRFGQTQVDSLNVSVAAGLLCEAFLRKPSLYKNGSKKGDSDPKVVDNRIF